jgi:bifunctional DNase/RNase
LDNIPEDQKLISVVINKFKDNEFFAKLRFKRGDKTKHLRVKLTEAVIASIREEVPILIDKAVITKSGITV